MTQKPANDGMRMAAYRVFQKFVVESWVLPRVMSRDRLLQEREHGLLSGPLKPRRPGVRRAWFHAASVGELESLTPVIEAWVERDGSEALVTVLSESAGESVKKLARLKGAVLYAGYSPWEGRWELALRDTHADVFVTAKYEAWPELWVSLAQLGIPLVIVGAKARRSLRLASVLCRALGGRAPILKLLAASQDDVDELSDLFKEEPQAQIVCAGEPRWDRVNARANQGSVRARELIERLASLPRPWGMLAQVWPEDLEIWKDELRRHTEGTLWVTPHRIDEKHLALIKTALSNVGFSARKTSVLGARSAPSPSAAREVVLVDEMGVLLNLYAAMDWAYVGGGFGAGTHSTIEPALSGLPIACGPRGEDKFAEIPELESTGQLTVIRGAAELSRWLAGLQDSHADRERWQGEARQRLGATDRVLKSMIF